MNGRSTLGRANDLLLTKQFKECLELCLRCIADLKSVQESARTDAEIESLCVVAVQAYAESDRWQEVLPFVTQLYNGIEDCPARIVQLSILLHAYMRDYTTCNAIAHIWLRNPGNLSSKHYSSLVEIYLSNVVVPQKKWKDVQPFLDSCQGLADEARNKFQRQVLAIQAKYEEAEIKKLRDTEIQKEIDKKKRNTKEVIPSFPINVAIGIYHWLSKLIPKVILQFMARLTLLALVTYWFISRGHLDFVSNPKFKTMFSSIIRLWKSMFAPFHLMRR